MRWIWIDRIIELERATRAVAIKNVSLAEEIVHDHFEAEVAPDGTALDAVPVMPSALLIEGMAQTAGILVGHDFDFKEKVILAKVSKAKFDYDVVPGQTVRFEADVENMDPGGAGASTKGIIKVLDHATGKTTEIGQVDLIFSFIDQNRAGLDFPEENFVFTDNFKTLLTTSGII